ncbi:MAG: SDR family NAD(P)-dependent oxidoreductase [Sphaerochaetaceae bacterium]|jgi:NAD(P)-dependent dehydrogenase (short-subunit alcohol dehydrogenase family)
MGQFEGKTILITGGAGDIGLATAKRFAIEGASIALVDIKSMESSLAVLGKHAKAYECDVTDYQQVEQMVSSVVKDFGKIDMLFNNAGIQGEFAMLHTYPVEDFHRVIQINLIGAFHVLRCVSAHMVETGGGTIVNTASMAGVDGPVNMAAYGASKFAIIGLTQTAAKDLAPFGIRANSISPGFMGPGFMWDRQIDLQAAVGSQYYDTDRAVVTQQMIGAVPLRRYGLIEEIPPAVVFLMSNESSYITGVNIKLSGGI